MPTEDSSHKYIYIISFHEFGWNVCESERVREGRSEREKHRNETHKENEQRETNDLFVFHSLLLF